MDRASGGMFTASATPFPDDADTDCQRHPNQHSDTYPNAYARPV